MTPMSVNLQRAKLLFSAAFQEGVESLKDSVDITWDKKATKVSMPGTETAVYGFLAEQPLFKLWQGERTVKTLKTGSYSLAVKDYEFTYKLSRNDVKYDRFGLLTDHMRGAGRASGRFYEDSVNAAQVAGKTQLCFDGQFFYDTDHPYGLDGSGSTFSNLWTSMAFTAANIKTRYAYMAQLQDANGKRMGIRPNIIEFGPEYVITFREIFGVDLIALAASTATSNAGISNVMTQLGLTPVLNNDITDGAWYMHDTRAMKPFLIQEETAPMGLQMRVDPTDPSVWDNREFLFGSEATAGFGYTLPHLSVRCEP